MAIIDIAPRFAGLPRFDLRVGDESGERSHVAQFRTAQSLADTGQAKANRTTAQLTSTLDALRLATPADVQTYGTNKALKALGNDLISMTNAAPPEAQDQLSRAAGDFQAMALANRNGNVPEAERAFVRFTGSLFNAVRLTDMNNLGSSATANALSDTAALLTKLPAKKLGMTQPLPPNTQNLLDDQAAPALNHLNRIAPTLAGNGAGIVNSARAVAGDLGSLATRLDSPNTPAPVTQAMRQTLDDFNAIAGHIGNAGRPVMPSDVGRLQADMQNLVETLRASPGGVPSKLNESLNGLITDVLDLNCAVARARAPAPMPEPMHPPALSNRTNPEMIRYAPRLIA